MEYNVNETYDLQLFSLMQCMSAIGYKLMRTERGGYVFMSTLNINKEEMLMSFNRAVRLYNNGIQDKYDLYFQKQFEAAKIVKEIKIQYSKKQKRAFLQSVNSSLVKVVEPEYKRIFGLTWEG